jgi:hypothetical protein
VKTPAAVRKYKRRRWNPYPHVTAHFWLVPHGYQMDVFVNGRETLSECRDFAGDRKVDDLVEKVVVELQALTGRLRKASR